MKRCIRLLEDLDRRILLLILTPLSLIFILSLLSTSSFSLLPPNRNPSRDKIAVCLVGGARRFELTGPSIVKNVINVYPNSDLFLHSPFDKDSFKFSILKNIDSFVGVKVFRPTKMNESESELRVLTASNSPNGIQGVGNVAGVKVFRATKINESEAEMRVLTASNSPNGIQGLLQYFNLVEGCLTMIKSHQLNNNFTYDWIVRTRVDGYWSGPLKLNNFVPGQYIVPPGSSYGGLNDRLGVGDLKTSEAALSRLSLIPTLDSLGFRQLNSESSFKAQLTALHIPYIKRRAPFCVVTDRKYDFPPGYFGVPVAAISSRGPLSGAKCRPCKAVCTGPCVGRVMNGLGREWSWTDWANNTLDLCDAHGEWENDWEKIFDKTVGKKLAAVRREVKGLSFEKCVADFEEMRRRTAEWDAPEATEICKVGLGSN